MMTRDAITQLDTLVKQNGALIEQVDLSQPITSMLTELNAGKQQIVDAILALGGTATTDMSFQQLANAITELGLLMPLGTNVNSFAIWNDSTNRNVSLSGIRSDRSTSWVNKFQNFSSLRNLTVGGNLLLPLCTTMSGMFLGCGSLQSVDFRGLDTSNVTNMSNIFLGCGSLQSVDFRGLDTSNVTNTGQMFRGCSALQSLNLQGFSASSVTSVTAMFSECTLLQTLVGNTTYEDVVSQNIGVFIGLKINFPLNFNSVLLTHASLRAVINGLSDRTGLSALTLTMKATDKAQLTAEDIAIATAKNWIIA